MSATAILGELQRRGVKVIADGDALVLKPRRALDNELLARVREHKPEIIRALSARPATCALSCYEIEPQPRQIVEQTCWHCGGSGQCDCISCGCFETHAVWKAGRCVPCEVRMRERVQ